MTEPVQTEVLYNAMEGTVTIRVRPKGLTFAEDPPPRVVLVLPVQDALGLGSQLNNLLRPIYAPIWVAPQ
jgi:hypothetical protein